MNAPDPACARARCLLSLALDGETTPFEEAFVASHLDGCTLCSEHSLQVEAATIALRGAALEQPLLQPAFASRRRLNLRHVQAAAAALVILGAGLSGLSGLPGHPQAKRHATRPARPAYIDSTGYEIRLIHTAAARPPLPGASPLSTFVR